jgi:hypothetical protein
MVSVFIFVQLVFPRFPSLALKELAHAPQMEMLQI